MEQTAREGYWRIWVCPEQKIVSFHHETGFQLLEFHKWELFLRCMEWYTEKQYRYQ